MSWWWVVFFGLGVLAGLVLGVLFMAQTAVCKEHDDLQSRPKLAEYEDLLELCEECHNYVDPYFRKKWALDAQLLDHMERAARYRGIRDLD